MRRLLGVLLKYVRAVVRFILIITNNIYCIPTHVIWLTLLMPVRKYAPDVFYRIEGYLFSWLLAMVSMWSWSAGYNIVEQGDDITRCMNKRTLVVVNHQSTADVPMLMAAFNSKPGVFNHIMWIMDRIFKYTNFGVVSSFHKDFFIASGKAKRDESVRRLKCHLKNAYMPLQRHWMVLFPEGGFLRKRMPISQRFAAKNNLPVMKNVTLPRMGALFVIRDMLMGGSNSSDGAVNRQGEAATVEEEMEHNISNKNNCSDTTSGSQKSHVLLKNTSDQQDNNNQCIATCKLNGHNGAGERPKDYQHHKSNGNVITVAVENNVTTKSLVEDETAADLEYILDITIGYPDGKPLDLLNIVHGLREPCETVIYYRLYSTKDIPCDDARLSTWMYDRFIEKESLLEYFYKHKTFLKETKDSQAIKKMNGHGESKFLHEDKNAGVGGDGGDDLKVILNRNSKGISEGGSGNMSVLVQQDLLRFIILHLFFITSSYVHYRILSTFYDNCVSLYSFS